MKRAIVSGLEKGCTLGHVITHRRPWLWLPLPWCPLADLGQWLDEKWGTGVWTKFKETEDA